MKNVVSFETARALKEANFPQPEPEFGQIWYDAEGTALLIFSPPGDFVTVVGSVLYPESTNDLFFAPTATDILRELPETALLSRIENDWQCRIMSHNKERCEYAIRNANPAEACAAAWLQIQKPAQ